MPEATTGGSPIQNAEVFARIVALGLPQTPDIRVIADEVESAEPSQAESGAPKARIALYVKVRVASTRKDPFPFVSPKRFCLKYYEKNGDEVKRAAPMVSLEKQPALPSHHLRSGEETEGWLRFLIPADAQSISLRSDLLNPEIALPISIPPPKKGSRRAKQ